MTEALSLELALPTRRVLERLKQWLAMSEPERERANPDTGPVTRSWLADGIAPCPGSTSPRPASMSRPHPGHQHLSLGIGRCLAALNRVIKPGGIARQGIEGFLMTDPHFMTIAQASAQIKARTLSPVELTKAFLARVKTVRRQAQQPSAGAGRTGTGRRKKGRIRGRGRQLEGPPARHPDRIERHLQHRRHPYDRSLRVVQGPYPHPGCLHGNPSAPGRCRHNEQVGDLGICHRRIVVRPALAAGAQSLGRDTRPVRLVVRIGRRGRRRAVHGRDGQRHRRPPSADPPRGAGSPATSRPTACSAAEASCRCHSRSITPARCAGPARTVP